MLGRHRHTKVKEPVRSVFRQISFKSLWGLVSILILRSYGQILPLIKCSDTEMAELRPELIEYMICCLEKKQEYKTIEG